MSACRFSMHQYHDPANAGKATYMNVASLPGAAQVRDMDNHSLPNLRPTCGVAKPAYYGQGCSSWNTSPCPTGTNLNPAGVCVPPYGEQHITPAFSSASSCIGSEF